eukprot:Skav214224  [mRNA]  locus=scaffold856:49898:50429:- [translate_table: standard]
MAKKPKRSKSDTGKLQSLRLTPSKVSGTSSARSLRLASPITRKPLAIKSRKRTSKFTFALHTCRTRSGAPLMMTT